MPYLLPQDASRGMELLQLGDQLLTAARTALRRSSSNTSAPYEPSLTPPVLAEPPARPTGSPEQSAVTDEGEEGSRFACVPLM